MGISKNVKADVLSQWEAQSSSQEWGRYSGGWVLLQAGQRWVLVSSPVFAFVFPLS